MKLSPRGAVLAIRPHLGRTKRSLEQRRKRLSPSGTPDAEMEPSDAAGFATAKFLTGIAMDRAGRPNAAIDLYRSSVELDPRYGRRWLRLGRLLRESGRFDEAIAAYWAAHERFPVAAEPILWYGLLHLRDRIDLAPETTAPEAAQHLLSTIGSIDAQAAYFMAVLCDVQGDVDGARRFFDASFEQEPDRPARLLRFARFEASEGNIEVAVAAYRSALTLIGDHDLEELDALDPRDVAEELTKDGPDVRGDEWASVAALARAQLDLAPDDEAARRSLGLALYHTRHWAEATEVLARVCEIDRIDLTLLERLATAAARCGDVATAIDARQRCVVLGPTGARFLRLATELQAGGRLDESVVAFQHAIHLGAPNHTWFERFGAVQRNEEEWAEAVLVYRIAVERLPTVGHLWYLLGFSLEKTFEIDEAQAAYERAIELDPDDANRHFRLGYLHERFGPEQTIFKPRTGLEHTAAGDLKQAAGAYRRAIELDPDRVAFWKRLAGVEELRGDLDASRDAYQRAVDLDPDDANSWHLLGRSISTVATRRGMYHETEHDELERIWGQAVELEPNRSGSRDQLIRASIKAGRWPLADALAWYPPPPISNAPDEDVLRNYLAGTGDDIKALAATLDAPAASLMWIPKEWWFPLHWRLLTDNYFTLAYRAKELMAERIVHDGAGRLDENFAGFLEHARALTFLGRNHEALAALTPSLTANHPVRTRMTLSRQAADVSLLMGDVRPHIELRGNELERHVEVAEDAFSNLIRGQRIAIVGPGMSEAGHGPEIDAHDVVIRTKFTRHQLGEYAAMAGSRTDVSYYALGSARFLRDDIVDALENDDLKMAVFRTSTYTPDPPFLVRPGDVRYVPSEFTAGFRASQFAIQRIFYDIIRYRPSSVKVFNIDFFLSPEAYRPGYLAGYANEAEKQGFLKVLGAFGHDFLADFEFTQNMVERGMLEVDDQISEILKLSPSEYLAALDRRN